MDQSILMLILVGIPITLIVVTLLDTLRRIARLRSTCSGKSSVRVMVKETKDGYLYKVYHGRKPLTDWLNFGKRKGRRCY